MVQRMKRIEQIKTDLLKSVHIRKIRFIRFTILPQKANNLSLYPESVSSSPPSTPSRGLGTAEGQGLHRSPTARRCCLC